MRTLNVITCLMIVLLVAACGNVEGDDSDRGAMPPVGDEEGMEMDGGVVPEEDAEPPAEVPILIECQNGGLVKGSYGTSYFSSIKAKAVRFTTKYIWRGRTRRTLRRWRKQRVPRGTR